METRHCAVQLVSSRFIFTHDFTVRITHENYCDTVNSSYHSDVLILLNMFFDSFRFIYCIIFVLLFLCGRNKCLHFRQHTLTSWRVTAAKHIDPTLLLFLENREIVASFIQIPYQSLRSIRSVSYGIWFIAYCNHVTVTLSTVVLHRLIDYNRLIKYGNRLLNIRTINRRNVCSFAASILTGQPNDRIMLHNFVESIKSIEHEFKKPISIWPVARGVGPVGRPPQFRPGPLFKVHIFVS